MTSIFSAISFIKSVSGSSVQNGIATYRSDDNEFQDFNFKIFTLTNNEYMVQRIKEKTVMLLTGKFAFENSQLDVSITYFEIISKF